MHQQTSLEHGKNYRKDYITKPDGSLLTITEVRIITPEEAHVLFVSLPSVKRIATLSPAYVLMDSKRDESVDPLFLLVEDGDKFWLNGVLKGRVPNSDYSDFQSPYGYGGPVSNTDDEDFQADAWGKYISWCFTNNILAEFIRSHPLNDCFYGGSRTFNRMTVNLPVDAKFSSACRNKCRKAEKAGVEIVPFPNTSIPEDFKAGYRTAMGKLRADGFYYFNDAYFDALAEMPYSRLFVAMIDGNILSAGVFLECGDTLEYHLSYTTDYGRELAATNLLIGEAFEYARRNGMKRLYLGGGKTQQEGDPLLEFKASFGGKLLPFHVGSCIHRRNVYYAMESEASQVSPVNGRTLFWR